VRDHVVVLLRFISSVSNLSLLTMGGHHYYDSHGTMMEKEMVTGQEFGMSIGGCNGLCPAATGHSLVALFPCSCRLRTIRCWTLVKSQTYIPSTYLLMGVGRLVTLLSWVSALSGLTNWRREQVEV
jgi:hypothetical protein